MAYGDGSKPYKRADGYWVASYAAGYTERGTRRRKYVTAKTEAECKRRLRDALRAYRAEGDTAVDPKLTVKRWCDEWLTWYETQARPRTFVTDSGNVRRWIVPAIGNRRLSELTVADIRKVDRDVAAAGRSATTVANVARLLRRVLKAAVVAGHKIPAPVLAAPLPSPGLSDRDAMPPEDAARVLAMAADRSQWPHFGSRPKSGKELRAWTGERVLREVDTSRWMAALLQGLRQGEALGLTWDRVDLDRGVMDISWQLQRIKPSAVIPVDYEARHISGTYHLVRPKTQAGRRLIPIVSWMGVALADWRERCPAPDGLVWPRASGDPMSSHDDCDAWKALVRYAGVSRLGREYVLHEARHSTASLLLSLDIPVEVVIAIMGHSSILSTRSYQHVDLTRARHALERVADRLALPPTPRP